MSRRENHDTDIDLILQNCQLLSLKNILNVLTVVYQVVVSFGQFVSFLSQLLNKLDLFTHFVHFIEHLIKVNLIISPDSDKFKVIQHEFLTSTTQSFQNFDFLPVFNQQLLHIL